MPINPNMPIWPITFDLLTPTTCFQAIKRAFGEFDLLMSTISRIPVHVANISFRSYKLHLKTRSAPLLLATPNECFGGLQFALMRKQFVYRWDNCVLSFSVAGDEQSPAHGWSTAGEMYLTSTIDDAQELLNKLMRELLKSNSDQAIGNSYYSETILASPACAQDMACHESDAFTSEPASDSTPR